MEKRLLICDSSVSLGRLMARRFTNSGIPADCCRGFLSDIEARCRERSYSSVMLFAFFPDKKLSELIKRLKQNGTKVFIGLYDPSPVVYDTFRKAGAVRCFTMPCSVNELCRRIIIYIDADGGLLTQIEIFLEEYGFPRNLQGFYYLAKASELCLRAPERLWGGMTGIYKEVAGGFGTKPALVERALRNLGSHMTLTSSVYRLTEGRFDERPTNTELICAVCDTFARTYPSAYGNGLRY